MLNWFRRRPVRREPDADAVTAGELEIGQGWARSATHFPSRTGGYFVVTNRGKEADRLVSASSPAAEAVEIHAITVVDAGLRMRPRPDGLAVRAGGTLTLKPRGYHLLLTRLKAPPMVGGRLPVTLCFERAGRVDIELAVREPGLVGTELLDQENHCG